MLEEVFLIFFQIYGILDVYKRQPPSKNFCTPLQPMDQQKVINNFNHSNNFNTQDYTIYIIVTLMFDLRGIPHMVSNITNTAVALNCVHNSSTTNP